MHAHDRSLDPGIAHIGGAPGELLYLGLNAPEELDEQGAADIERFVHHRVHLRVVDHLRAHQLLQTGAQTPDDEDEAGK